MKLAIMQPYFFPYLGYFSLIKHSDLFVILDEVQYMRHSWVNRNKILGPKGSWNYIILPLKKHSRNTKIKDVIVSGSIDWKSKILRQLEYYKKIAPNYDKVLFFLDEFFKTDEKNLCCLNIMFLKKACKYMGINFNYRIFSRMNLKLGQITLPGDWALEISKALKAKEYLNPVGGQDLFNKNQFKEQNIKLNFLKIKLSKNNNQTKEIEPGLSIIDVMMFYDTKQINKFLDDYEVIS